MVAIAYQGTVWKSTDSGAMWVEQTQLGTRDWWSVACSADAETVLLSVYGEYMYLSTDFLATFEQQTSPGTAGWYTVYSAVDGFRLAAIDDGGFVWTSP